MQPIFRKDSGGLPVGDVSKLLNAEQEESWENQCPYVDESKQAYAGNRRDVRHSADTSKSLADKQQIYAIKLLMH